MIATQVREMAAKALCALIPLRAVPSKAAALLEELNASIACEAVDRSGPRTFPLHNQLHGTLSLCYELLDSLRRRLAGVGDNKTFLLLLQVGPTSQKLPINSTIKPDKENSTVQHS